VTGRRVQPLFTFAKGNSDVREKKGILPFARKGINALKQLKEEGKTWVEWDTISSPQSVNFFFRKNTAIYF
jgi:hypothetical protein